MKYLILTFLVVSQTWASSFKNFQIIARANNFETYSLPSSSFLNNVTPQINNWGDASFHVVSYQDEKPSHGLFYKSYLDIVGEIVYSAPNQRYISDPSMSGNGNIVFNQFDDGLNDGVFLFNSNTYVTQNFISPKILELESFSRAKINYKNDVIFRANDNKGDRLLIVKKHDEVPFVLARHGQSIDTDAISYLFEPAIRGKYIVTKVRYGETRRWEESRPDMLIKWNLDNGTKESVFDTDYDNSSSFKKFLNSVSTSSEGAMVFISEDSKKKKAIYIQNDNSVKKVIEEGAQDILFIENFSVAINIHEDIAFRAIKKNGRRAIFYIKNNRLSEFISEGDYLPSDEETARIIMKPGFPGFSGGININDNGQIIFHCLIESKNGERQMGSAIYIGNME